MPCCVIGLRARTHHHDMPSSPRTVETACFSLRFYTDIGENITVRCDVTTQVCLRRYKYIFVCNFKHFSKPKNLLLLQNTSRFRSIRIAVHITKKHASYDALSQRFMTTTSCRGDVFRPLLGRLRSWDTEDRSQVNKNVQRFPQAQGSSSFNYT